MNYEETIDKQFDYDKKVFEHQWGIDKTTGNQNTNADGTNKGVQWDNYYYSKDSVDNQRAADTEAREYQEQTMVEDWKLGKSQQEYQWSQEDAAFQKNQQWIHGYTDPEGNEIGGQFHYNQIEYNDNLEREQSILNEQFIEAGFENQGMIADLYEATGSLGFDKAAVQLGLQKQEDIKESGQQKILNNLNQNTSAANFNKAGTQIGMIDKAGKYNYDSAGIKHNLFVSEADNSFKKASILLDVNTKEREAEFQNDLIRKEVKSMYGKAAHESTERNLEALKAQGQASLTQSGRSQGKAVQMVLAELGRQNAYVAESLISGQNVAEARMKRNQQTSLETGAKADLAINQIQQKSSETVEKTLMDLENLDRDLKISNAKGTLNLDKIKEGVYNNITNSALDQTILENDLKHNQTQAGFDYKKIDWKTDLLGDNFKRNQEILIANIDSAVEAAGMNVKDLKRAKQKADLQTFLSEMLDPSLNRDKTSVDNVKPKQGVYGNEYDENGVLIAEGKYGILPVPKYQDPQDPDIPPAPIKGAHVSQSSYQPQKSIVGSAIAGFGGAQAISQIAKQAGATKVAGFFANPVVGAILTGVSFLFD